MSKLVKSSLLTCRTSCFRVLARKDGAAAGGVVVQDNAACIVIQTCLLFGIDAVDDYAQVRS